MMFVVVSGRATLAMPMFVVAFPNSLRRVRHAEAHKIMIEQGSAWAILGLNDRGEKPGTSALGRWLHAEKDSTDEGKIRFTSDSKEHLYWEWKSESLPRC
ncbi:hypothetical protein [Bosea sp. PAMC 26642]|uniref:hypothetical protein n=1 Tax=Bosea sp. (strain PAMC 26642) TaxID=1792307 RepID=UPI000770394D|nr:hypothetical protein [Bosea sp. PAMC 26642]AMJ61131.1 hypothetical protein AXW83_13260 [Bosea sp. PAMC 26642]